MKDVNADDHLHIGLAPTYGILNKDSGKDMDEMLKVTIAGTMLELKESAKDKGGPLSWKDVMSILNQNALIEPVPGDHAVVDRVDKFLSEGVDIFKFDASHDDGVVKNVGRYYL